MTNVALIGNGIIAEAHHSAYKKLIAEGMSIKIAAICDIRPERLENCGDAHVYTDIDELLANEKNIDYADICLPTYLHAEASIKCMNAGLHVLCEKPMALNEAETKTMLDCAAKTGKTLMVAQVNRFLEQIRIVREYVVNQTLGKPLSAFFIRPGGLPTGRYEEWMHDEKKSGGCILDYQIHDIDLVNWMFGMPHHLSTAARYYDGIGYSSVAGTFFYEDGLFVQTWGDWMVEHNKFTSRTIRVNFEHGYIYHERGSRNILTVVDENGTVTDLLPTMKLHPDMYRNEIEYFVSCIINGDTPRFCQPNESSDAVRIVMAQMESASKGGEIVYLDKEY